MKAQNNISQLLERSLVLTSKLVNFSDLLEKSNKNAIAYKVLESGIKLSNFLFEAKTAVLDFDASYKLEKASNSAKDIQYWLKQCNRSSSYPSDEELLKEVDVLIADMIEKNTNIKSKCTN